VASWCSHPNSDHRFSYVSLNADSAKERGTSTRLVKRSKIGCNDRIDRVGGGDRSPGDDGSPSLYSMARRYSRGVSKWLFIGQLAASLGFIMYSWQLKNWVFVVTNVLMLLTVGLGQWIYLSNKKVVGTSTARNN
jgi:hypothetical protein